MIRHPEAYERKSVFACDGSKLWIMIDASKKVPVELRRLAVVGIVAGVVTTAVIYSRGEHVALEGTRHGSKQPFQQPKDRQQAEGWFTPTPRPDISDDKAAEIANAVPLPPSRPSTPGFYYELVRAQGDGEGNYVLVERKCVPKVDMPEPCYLPERGRRNFPLRRE
jgi:hypothetical protein